MELYPVGDVIRDARHKHGLTQEELAFGVCSVSTLSKIETGQRSPHPKTFESLMQKMGESGSMYVSYIKKDDLMKTSLVQELEREIRMENWVNVRCIMNSYQDNIVDESIYYRQWGKLAEAVLALSDGEEAGMVEGNLREILRSTRPDYEDKWDERGIYTHCELLIVQIIAQCRQKNGDFIGADNLLTGLLSYYKKFAIDEIWARDAEISICYQLADLYFSIREYMSSAGYCAKGLEKSIFYQNYRFIFMLLIQWSHITAELGYTEESRQAVSCAALLGEIWTKENYLSKWLRFEHIEDIIDIP